TETGIIMLVYLRQAIDKRGGLENIKSLAELRAAVVEGAVHRLRPKLLTEGVAIIAIFPMVFATGVGAEVLAPMALPVLGGLLISDEVVDLFLPVRFFWVRRARWLKLEAEGKLTGSLMCGKCSLKNTPKCSNVLQVKEGDKLVNYIIDDKGNGEDYHEPVCGDGKVEGVTVTGTVSEKDGKKYVKASKVNLPK